MSAPGKRRRAPAKVTVTRPGVDAEVLSAATIRRRARQKHTGPKLPLTRVQRAELFNGGQPRIVLPAGHRPFEPGDIYSLPGSKSVWIGVIGVKELEGGEGELAYKTFDERPRLLRASVHGVDFDAIRRSYDSKGQPTPMRDEGAVVAAAEESGYTSSPGAALPGAGEEISRGQHDELMRSEREEREGRIKHRIAQAHEAIGDMESDEDFRAHASDIRFLGGLVSKLEGQLLNEQRAAEQ